MRVLADRGAVLGACLLMALAPAPGAVGAAEVVWLLLAVVVGGLCAVADGRRGAIVLPASYLLAGCPWAASAVGAPLVVYDLVRQWALGSRRARLLAVCCAPLPVVPVVRARGAAGAGSAVAGAVVALLAARLALRAAQEEAARERLHAMRDDLHEKVVALRASRARLEEAREHETRAAALAERTRIARDIHDGVGHLLTRLLLQVKALAVTHRDEPAVAADLAELDRGLDGALSAMRRSVHALSDEGEDLATSLNLLGSRCGIGHVEVDCPLEEAPPPAVTRCLVAVVREALTNAARHGRASSARVRVSDYPAFWRVAVDNDGAVPERGQWPGGGAPSSILPNGAPAGLGLRSMSERLEALGGTVRLAPRPRFTVIATIPKGGA